MSTSEYEAVPSLNPVELQEARRASGKLGGRPRKPTQAEARAEALERLVPLAIRSLEQHLADGNPGAWRAGLQVLLLAYGRPANVQDDEIEVPDDPLDVRSMTAEQRSRLQAQILRDHPELASLVPSRRADRAPSC